VTFNGTQALSHILNASQHLAMSQQYSKQQAAEMVGKACVVNSYHLRNQQAVIQAYMPTTHHFWVVTEQAYVTTCGKISRWHKCNAGNCTLITQAGNNDPAREDRSQG
jgi:hypothetical protein